MNRGFARVSAAVPECRVGDIEANCEHILSLWRQADAEGAAVVVFPELCLTGYTVRDLFLDRHLLDQSEAQLVSLAQSGAKLDTLALVGVALRIGGGIYNVAAALHRGHILGLTPKAYLPTYREFEEARWFRPGTEVEPGQTALIGGTSVPFGLDLLYAAQNIPDLVVGAEICEDYWVHHPPSTDQISAGATVLCNLSASNFIVGKAEVRRLLAKAHSDRGKCAYIYVAAGPGESSTDLAFDADAFICENGSVLAESKRFSRSDQLITVDIDLDGLIHERISTNSFGDCARQSTKRFRRLTFSAPQATGLKRTVAAHPFLPSNPESLATHCWEVFEIQSNALATRMRAIGKPKLILGISGGLDSTQAALVAAQALDLCHQADSDLICVTMPGLGTTEQTKNNAEALAHTLGADFRTIPVADESRLVLKALGHPAAAEAQTVDDLIDALRTHEEWADVTVQNVQARLRTLILMSVANHEGGMVIGTGDLSEKALGWSTYAGDHISMYDVNAGIPKTLIQFVIRWVANERVKLWSKGSPDELRKTLFSILDTPISPELLPAGADGQIAQLTEETIGPYELHDFFLFHFVRRGCRPGRILDLASAAFCGRYDNEALRQWLRVFIKRFFRNQFKRSCTADAPKVLTVALSPRGDWRMPSDAKPDSWIAEVDEWKPA
jgi:NAD+ synthase (glutamine-hydrolysing)